MKTNRFDKFLSWIAILAVGGCIASLGRIVFHGYFAQIAHLGEEQAHWNRVFPTYASVFLISLFLALGCLAVYKIRKTKRSKREKII